MRDRACLRALDGLLFRRLVFVGSPRTQGFTIGLVDPRRQMAMCLWENEAALARFQRRSPIARAWREDTDEYCEVLMRPYRTHGSYRGYEPLAGFPARRPGGGPVVMWTFANIAPRNLWFFWSGIRALDTGSAALPGSDRGNRRAGAHVSGGDDVHDLGAGRRGRSTSPTASGRTRESSRRSATGGRLVDSMFIRSEPYAASGQVAGLQHVCAGV